MAYLIHDDGPDPEKAITAELVKALGASPEVADLLAKVVAEHTAPMVAEVDALNARLDKVIAVTGPPPPGPPRQSMTASAHRRWPP